MFPDKSTRPPRDRNLAKQASQSSVGENRKNSDEKSNNNNDSENNGEDNSKQADENGSQNEEQQEDGNNKRPKIDIPKVSIHVFIGNNFPFGIIYSRNFVGRKKSVVVLDVLRFLISG